MSDWPFPPLRKAHYGVICADPPWTLQPKQVVIHTCVSLRSCRNGEGKRGKKVSGGAKSVIAACGRPLKHDPHSLTFEGLTRN